MTKRLSTIDWDYRPSPIAYGLLTVLVIVFLTISPTAQTSDRARTESQARRASDRLQALQREADELAAQQRTLLSDLRRLEVERDLKTEQLKQIDADIEQLGNELGTIGNQIDEIESEEAESRPALEARIVELYKLGGAGYVRLLFSVSDLKEFGRAYRLVSALSGIDRQRATDHQKNLEQLQAARAAVEQRTREIGELQEGALAARTAVAQAAAARARLIAQIDSRRDLTAQLASELQSAQQRLQQTLGAISSGAPRAEPDGTALPIRPFKGDLDWPVTGRVMTRFNGRGGGAGGTLQNGIQVSAPEGTAVKAVHDGTIAFAGPFSGYGTLVIINHGSNTYSLYGQLDAVNVARDAKVERGQPVGTTGRVLVGIPGTYFEMRVDGKPVDPLEWLKKR